MTDSDFGGRSEKPAARDRDDAEAQTVLPDGGTATEDDSTVRLSKDWVETNIDIKGQQARAVARRFHTRERLLETCEGGGDLTQFEGIGDKTASAIWGWFKERGGSVDPDGTLVLDDDGLHLPDWLVGYTGTFTVETPTITMRPTTSKGLGEVSDTLGAYPNAGEWNERLEEGMLAFRTPGHEEMVYEIDDRRSEDGGGGDSV